MAHERREKVELMAEILEVCIDGASKTRIVTQTNLNFRTVEPYGRVRASLNRHPECH
jgi:predicted transcriptional regulator